MKGGTLLFIFLIVFPLSLLTSCRKNIPQGHLKDGEIALTFDDSNVDNWYTYLPFLDSLHIKATFYVSQYHTFSEKKKTKLREIALHGHEIAFHSTNHPDMSKMVREKGLAATVQIEMADLELMRKDGFTVTSFAYPFGQHTPELDAALLRNFKSIRAVSNKQNWNKSLVKQSGEKQLFYGAGIDQCSKVTEEEMVTLIDNAYRFHDCLVLLAHDINNPDYAFHISLERLRLLAAEAKKRNLVFVTIHDICL